MKDPKQDRLQSGAQEARPKAPGTTSNSTNWKADLKASLSKRKGKEEPLSAAPERHQPPAKKAKKETLEEERRASGLNASAPHSSKDRKNALPTLPPKSLAPALLPSTKPGKSAPQTAAAAPVAPRNPFQSARGSVQPAVNPFASKGKLSQKPQQPSYQGGGAGGGAGLIEKMRAKLQGGKFRQLNETLYTQDGSASFELMQEQPELFDEYHEGFREQTRGWPVQPVDRVIAWLKKQPKDLVVADFGCGDAKIMDSVQQKVHSMDLVATRPGVIACNMARTPLTDASVDVAVFCLALMGVDYAQFLREATRVLRPGGTLWIAEVRSRFAPAEDDDSSGSDDAGLKRFLRALEQSGYRVARQEKSKMFVEVVLKKGSGGGEAFAAKWPPLKACIYKRR